jgi:hypothetical protein
VYFLPLSRGIAQRSSRRKKVIERVSGAGNYGLLRRLDGRAKRLREQLERNDRIEFRHRSRRFTGTVAELRPNALVVPFELKDEEVTRPVASGGILTIPNR